MTISPWTYSFPRARRGGQRKDEPVLQIFRDGRHQRFKDLSHLDFAKEAESGTTNVFVGMVEITTESVTKGRREILEIIQKEKNEVG